LPLSRLAFYQSDEQTSRREAAEMKNRRGGEAFMSVEIFKILAFLFSASSYKATAIFIVTYEM